jgi:hypothetical protein
MRTLLLSLSFITTLATAAAAGEPTVIDSSARFPEGPVW